MSDKTESQRENVRAVLENFCVYDSLPACDFGMIEDQLLSLLQRSPTEPTESQPEPNAWRVVHVDPCWENEGLMDWPTKDGAEQEAEELFLFNFKDWFDAGDGSSWEPKREDYQVVPVWIGKPPAESQERDHRAMEKLRELRHFQLVGIGDHGYALISDQGGTVGPYINDPADAILSADEEVKS